MSWFNNSFIGNRDEPTPPEWYWPRTPSYIRNTMWFTRNPFHNFTHYTIGWVGKKFKVTYSRTDHDKKGFANGWLRATLQDDAGSKRRYVSYSSKKVETYLGWHPSNGKFGTRLTLRLF